MAFTGITIPGASSLPPVTISASSGDVLTLAAKISQLLGDLPPANLNVTEVTTGAAIPPAPAPVDGDTTELALNGPGGRDTSIPGGYSYVGVADATSDTLSGTNVVLVTNTVGGTYNVSGTSTCSSNGRRQHCQCDRQLCSFVWYRQQPSHRLRLGHYRHGFGTQHRRGG